MKPKLLGIIILVIIIFCLYACEKKPENTIQNHTSIMMESLGFNYMKDHFLPVEKMEWYVLMRRG